MPVLQSRPGQFYDPRASAARSTPIPQVPSGYVPSSYQGQTRLQPVQVLGTSSSRNTTPSTSSPISGGGGTSAQSPAGNQTLQNDVNRQVDDFGAIIDRDYETALGALQGQEEGLKGQASSSEQQIRAGYEPARTAIGQEQLTRESGLSTQESTARTQERSALQQARDLYRQLQQQNVAQLSGMGISSSSVSEALAERLGVETARRIAGVSGSTNEILQNIAQERTRVQTYYKQKLSDLEGQMSSQIAGIQQSLVSGLNQINTARQLAATDKANRRQELLSNAQSQIAQLQAQAQNFAQSLQQWQAQRESSLRDAQGFVVKPTDFNGLTGAINNISSLPQVAGFSAIPQFENVQGGYRVTPKYQKPNEDIVNPFAQ